MSVFLYLAKRTLLLMFDDGRSFEWHRGSTPLSSIWWPIISALVYLLTLAVLKSVIKEPVHVPTKILMTHNLILSIGSGIMFVGCLSSVIQEALDRESVDFLFCTPQGTSASGRLYFWSTIYYYSKFYELLDTILLVLRKKPTSFLHVFHHAVVITMSWLWVDQVQTLQFIGLLANTAVHVVMYYYYYLTVIGKSPWWKKYITSMQIVQFVSSFLCLPAFFWYQFVGKAEEGGCAGINALIFNGVFNLCLLVLFVQFFLSTYKKKRKQDPKKTQ